MSVTEIIKKALGMSGAERTARQLTRVAAAAHATRAINEAAESARLRKLEYTVDLKRGRYKR